MADGTLRRNSPEEKAILSLIGEAAAVEARKHGVKAVAVCVVLPSGYCSNSLASDEAEPLATLLRDGPRSFSRFIEHTTLRILAGDPGTEVRS